MANRVRLTAGPFQTFSQISEFHQSVSRLHGVGAARIRSAAHGSIVLEIDYAGLVPLHVRLRELVDIRWRPVRVADHEVEITVV